MWKLRSSIRPRALVIWLVTLFDQMVSDGRMPQPKQVNSIRVWDRLAIDAAFESLPSPTKSEANEWDALIGAWYASPAWAQLQPQTQRVYRLLLDRFRETYGAGTVANLKPAHLVKILDKYADRPSQAARLLKLLRAVYRFALARGLAASDPTVGIRLAPRKSAGFRPWTDADI
ncbi:MAG: hypothetical protein LW828_10605, partial [Xanthomonadaceae bacterium]|nr:hypothetical protein [Xanthomonadaceae bacterium]